MQAELTIEELDFVDRALKCDRTDPLLADAQEEAVGDAPRSCRGVEGVYQGSVDVEMPARRRRPVDRCRDVMPIPVADDRSR